MTNRFSRYAQVLSWLDQHVIKRLYTERVRRVILQSLPFWVASLVTGLVAVGYEELFVWAEQISFSWLQAHPYLLFITTPIAFLIAWLLVAKLAPAAREVASRR